MTVRIITGDCRVVLADLPDASVHCVVTSPPYYGLRDYGTADQVGQEDTPEAYVSGLVDIFREIRRVLHHDGTVWLNLGDSYHDKNRLLIPPRVALALQADGWIVRDEIIWHKPRTTPSSVLDRTVASHELIYLLTKRPTYFFDWEAIEQPAKYAGLVRHAGKAFRDLAASDPNAARKRPNEREIVVRETRRARSVWSISPSPYKHGHFATMPPNIAETCIKAGCPLGGTVLDPFGGAGTTGLVADRLQRDCILIEQNAHYCAVARERIVDDSKLFASVV